MAPPSAVPENAPAEARSLVLFANARRLGRRPDPFAELATAKASMIRAELLDLHAPLTAAAARRLAALRDALNAVLAGDERGWETLDAAAARLRLRLSFATGPAANVVTPEDPAARLLVNLYRAIENGSWQRIRLCANPVCAAAFYDGTRSRTQRWHAYATCGNRANVAAHRARSHTP